MAYIDITEPHLAWRYAQGVSAGIAAGYGMAVPEQLPMEITYSPAYTRGFRAAYTAVWNARYGTAERQSTRRYIAQEKALGLSRAWSAALASPREREEFVEQWLGPKWTPGNPSPKQMRYGEHS